MDSSRDASLLGGFLFDRLLERSKLDSDPGSSSNLFRKSMRLGGYGQTISTIGRSHSAVEGHRGLATFSMIRKRIADAMDSSDDEDSRGRGLKPAARRHTEDMSERAPSSEPSGGRPKETGWLGMMKGGSNRVVVRPARGITEETERQSSRGSATGSSSSAPSSGPDAGVGGGKAGAETDDESPRGGKTAGGSGCTGGPDCQGRERSGTRSEGEDEGDGRKQEVIPAERLCPGLKPELLHVALKIFDLDGSGTITREVGGGIRISGAGGGRGLT